MAAIQLQLYELICANEIARYRMLCLEDLRARAAGERAQASQSNLRDTCGNPGVKAAAEKIPNARITTIPGLSHVAPIPQRASGEGKTGAPHAELQSARAAEVPFRRCLSLEDHLWPTI